MPTFKLTTYPSWTTITISAASLATSSSLLAGRASTAVSNTSDLFVDAMVAGVVRVGTTPTAGQIEVWAYAAFNGSPTYPDSITGTDANKTMTSANVKAASLRLLWAASADAGSSDRDFFMPPTSLKEAFGVMPSNWGLFLVHSTGVNLNSTGGNHAFAYRGVTFDSV
jgi:hypothetical protein